MLSRINIAPALPLVALLVAFFAAPVFASNRLVDSQSPYLLQHATNPVDWYPWGEEAFAKAREENKLVFVSIGYSTCHWCHVMNRESFSDPEIAAYLNENYVCIKVDREERPDVDIVYMNFVQSLTGTGGWPLNVWLTPKKQPFFGGTYFPPRSEQGRAGFLETSQQIQSLWSADPSQIRNQSADIVQRLNRATTIEGNGSETDALELVSHAISGLFFNYDQEHGGFDPGEKFPSPTTLSFLLRASCLMTLPDEDRDLARRLAVETLEAMAQGGIRDHLGGGFHRYSVDPAWRLPHFEKMLYDQALLAEVYVDAFQATGDHRFKTVATETLDYAIRDLRHPDGAFYSAEDAESADPKNPNTKREGAFYLWTEDEIDRLIREPAMRALVKAHFDIRPEGNAPEGPFPTAPFQGYNTPRAAVAPDQLADSHGIVPADAAVWIREAKSKLFAARQNRPRPHLDDKIITAWNGLAISALSRAAQAFDRPDYATAATEAAQFIRRELYNSESGELTRLYRDAASEVNGFAIDYACLIDGLIDLYEATADHQWLEWAHALQQTQDRLFYDEADGAYFSFTQDGENALQPLKETFDSALPAPSSLAVKNLARLAQFFDHDSYATQARKTLDVLAPLIEAEPTRLPALLEAVPYIEGKPLQIVIAGEPEGEGAKALARVVHQQLLPHRLVLHADGGAGQAYLGQRLEFIEHVTAIGGKATAYVCENFVCQLPTSDLEVLKQQLSRFHPSR